MGFIITPMCDRCFECTDDQIEADTLREAQRLVMQTLRRSWTKRKDGWICPLCTQEEKRQ